MGLSESSLNTITKPLDLEVIVKYHMIVHVFPNYVVKIIFTHEYDNDSDDEDHIENNNNLLRNVPQQVVIISNFG